MNLPNKLTMLRIIMVPVFVVFLSMDEAWCRYVALILFIAASLTDLLDGRIARARNLITDFGKFMDPIADKLLVMSALVVLVALGITPAWVCIIMLAREFIVSGFRLVAAGKGKVIAAAIWGKLKTVSQMIYIPMAILLMPVGEISDMLYKIWNILTQIMMYLSAALALWSGFWYIWSNREYLSDM